MNRDPKKSTKPSLRAVSAFVLCLSALGWLAGQAPTSALAQTAVAQPDPYGEELFVYRVLPILTEKCFVCHGSDADDLRGEFNMLSREGLLRGGESETPSIAPGEPMESPLYLAVQWEGLEMPPKENDRLKPEQIEFIKHWIEAGAPWPDEHRIKELLKVPADKWHATDGVPVTTSGGLSEDWTNRRYEPSNLWAYQPLWTDTQGDLQHSSRNPIDVLLEAKLDASELSPAPPADRLTLIRRASLDLIGLPPNRAEVEAFVHDQATDQVAFAKVVERLLESPHYGEQWGRHWLDVVRYADSSGFANDYERGNAWRYRDYVVRSFNADKPYDQFVREQIAGDEIDATNPELLIAAGFLRMGPWELTGMEVAKVARQRFLDDVTDSVGQVFLGHMLQCARCHDHKFDPIPTQDYYSIQAAFATTQLAERSAAFLPQENTEGFSEQKYLSERSKFYAQCIAETDAKQTVQAAIAWYTEQGLDATLFEQIVAEIRAQRPAKEVDLQKVRQELADRQVDPTQIPPKHVGFEPRDFGIERVARKGLERLKWRSERYEPFALSVYSGRTPNLKNVNNPLRVAKNPTQDGELETTSILVGGDPFSPGPLVMPGTLSAVGLLVGSSGQIEESTEAIAGRRKALADWIILPENPLTARVMANRIWQWHFGQAIAGNPNNFGTTGKKPTHPELLDYLAGELIQSGWSIKSLHRSLMLSEAYRRASQHPQPDELAAKDPDGTSYAQFRVRRLEAEELRDAMLMVSGELNPKLGGIPIRPEINLEVALQPRQVMGTFAEAWQPSPLPEQRHRRSLYTLRIRGLHDPFLDVFNAPSPDLSCEAREASTVTPQVFAMFNSANMFDRALALANRVLDHEKPQDQIVAHLIELTYGRSARDSEVGLGRNHWNKMTARHRALKFEPVVYPSEVMREAVEENTGEKFSFVEPLEVYGDFVADLKPGDASPELRGLAELCLVLFNSNEFAYVY